CLPKTPEAPVSKGLALRKLVRAKGLEPPHLAILEPKSSASTSSATPAARRIPASESLRNRDAPLVGRAGKGKMHGCPKPFCGTCAHREAFRHHTKGTVRCLRPNDP